MADIIKGKSVPELYTFPARLIIRQSCGCKLKKSYSDIENNLNFSNIKKQNIIINGVQRNLIMGKLIGDVELQLDTPKTFNEHKDFIKIYLDAFIEDLENRNDNNKFFKQVLKLTTSSQGISFNLEFFKILVSKIYQYISPFLKYSPKLTSLAYDLYNSAILILLESLSRYNKNMLTRSRSNVVLRVLVTFNIDQL